MNLFKLFEQLKNTVRFDQGRKEEIRSKLAQFIQTHNAVRARDEMRHIRQRSIIRAFFLKPVPMPIVAIIAILSLVGGGTSFAAEGALPGDILYPVKVHVNENVVAAFQFTPQAKADWETVLADRRLEEASRLASEGRLNADVDAEIENNFEVHAKNVHRQIEELKMHGDVAVAADAASNFEGVLRGRRALFADLKTGSTSSIEIESEKSLDLKVGKELDDIFGERVDLEEKISESSQATSSETKAEFQAAAQGKLNAAANVIAEVKSFIALRQEKLGATATTDAQTQLQIAENLVADGNAKLQAGDYGTAFIDGNRAIRIAQGAKSLVRATTDLGLKLKIGHNGLENEEAIQTSTTGNNDEEFEASSTDDNHEHGDRSTEDSSGVNFRIPKLR